MVLGAAAAWPVVCRAADSDVRLSSIGYLPDRPKVASVIGGTGSFALRRFGDDAVLFDGTLSDPAPDNATGDELRFADFSAFAEPGVYVLEVPGVGRSVAFPIGENAYDAPLVTAMLGFYGWRAGVDVSIRHRGATFAHAAGHLQDGYLDYLGQPGVRQDGTGGWYDAGDYGKYVVNGALAVGTLLDAWEQFPTTLGTLPLPIPEAGGSLPDFLDEVRVEVEWMLRMQYPAPDDDGRISHKLTALDFEGFVLPADDDSVRYFAPYGTAATADFVAVMAQASRVYAPYDAAFAATCLAAAQHSYSYLVANPANVRADLTDFHTGEYQTDDPDDRLWAAAELWETTGDPAVLADLETRAHTTDFAVLVHPDFDWDDLGNLGMYTYALSERSGRDTALLDSVRQAIVDAADAVVQARRASGYGRGVTNWYWGSNGSVARTCLVLQVANRITPNPAFEDTCADQIAHLYGRNHYGRSQVTGEGAAPPCFPHHRPSGSDGVERPYPGLLVGGGQTPTNWRDSQGSYATNEVAINWSAALVYALAGFVRGAGADVTEPEPWRVDAYSCTPPPVLVPAEFSTDTSGPPSLIDDLEDGDLAIVRTEGRQGDWFAFDDGTAGLSTLAVGQPGRAAGAFAVRATGSGFGQWGGGIGFPLDRDASGRRTYDASGYTGITFWARVTPGPQTFALMVVDRNTEPEGGICGGCYDHFHTDFTVSSEWEPVTVTWGELQQGGWGDAEPNVDSAALYAIQFQYNAGQSFELWLDDLAFTRASLGEAGAGGVAGAGGRPEPSPREISARGGCACGVGRRTSSGSWLGLAIAAWLVKRGRRRARV
jgi:endoglucanase